MKQFFIQINSLFWKVSSENEQRLRFILHHRAGRKALKCVHFGRGGVTIAKKQRFLAIFQITFDDEKF